MSGGGRGREQLPISWLGSWSEIKDLQKEAQCKWTLREYNGEKVFLATSDFAV